MTNHNTLLRCLAAIAFGLAAFFGFDGSDGVDIPDVLAIGMIGLGLFVVSFLP